MFVENAKLLGFLLVLVTACGQLQSVKYLEVSELCGSVPVL